MPALILHLTKQDKKQNSKSKKTDTAVINAGPPGREYLHYPLDMEDVIVEASQLPALR